MDFESITAEIEALEHVLENRVHIVRTIIDTDGNAIATIHCGWFLRSPKPDAS